MAMLPYAGCIRICDDCAAQCEFCAAACLREANPAALSRCIALALDCAALCRQASRFMAHGSELARELCELAARAGLECAAECAQHPGDPCQECARICRHCAAACRDSLP